ncbi:MAG: toll/interleukin-1 receptor domain-containing protein [Alphaproteobacteria bacterium]|jgi:hypothetical protein|nr:toll/interleukin-1 receptor domain-containing protein [Alphaproteobacteria bacterium]
MEVNYDIFISHLPVDSKLAFALNRFIKDKFQPKFSIFLSSDGDTIIDGDVWLSRIQEGLKSCKIMLVLCSKNSVAKTWVNIEIGAAFQKGIDIIPICFGDMVKEQLPEPIKSLKPINLSEIQDFQQVFDRIAEKMNCKRIKILGKEYKKFLKDTKVHNSINSDTLIIMMMIIMMVIIGVAIYYMVLS